MRCQGRTLTMLVYEKHTLSVARWLVCVICMTCCISARSSALTRLRSPTMRTRIPYLGVGLGLGLGVRVRVRVWRCRPAAG